MAFDGSDPCWMPDIPWQRNDEWRLRIAKFGDGYEQRMLDGINALDQRWSLTWDNRESAVINAMVTYLINQQARSFLFGSSPQVRVFCDSWEISWNLRRRGGAMYGSLSAEFRKANGVTI